MRILQYTFYFLLIIASLSGVNNFAKANENPQSQPAAKASERLLMDIKALSNGRIITIGERGHLLISDDNGQSWQQKLVPTQALLTKLFFYNDNIGWAVGHQQTILNTSDGGDTWTLQRSSDNLDQPALFDIWFKDMLNGFSVGAYGLYLQTSDGGKTWHEVYQGELEDEEIGFSHFYSISFQPENQVLFLAGELGFMAQSSDLGQSWQKLQSPYHGSFFKILALQDGSLLAMGLRGHLFRSLDSGKNWQTINTGTIAVLQEALVLRDGRILILGTDGAMLLSENGGKSFTLNQRDDRIHLAAALELESQQLLLVGIKGVIKTSIK